jgi:hypothetical protein
MNDITRDYRHEVALFRYGVIADLVNLPPGTKGLYRKLDEKAAREYAIPGTSRTEIAAETLRDWLKQYRKGGFDALMPKRRADRGQWLAESPMPHESWTSRSHYCLSAGRSEPHRALARNSPGI